MGSREKCSLWPILLLLFGACAPAPVLESVASEDESGGGELVGESIAPSDAEPAPILSLEAQDPLALTLLQPTFVALIEVRELVSDPLLGVVLTQAIDAASDDMSRRGGSSRAGRRSALLQAALQHAHEHCGRFVLSLGDASEREQGSGRASRERLLAVLSCPTGADELAHLLAPLAASGGEPQEPIQVGEGPGGRPIERYSQDMEVYFDGVETFLLGSEGAPSELLGRWGAGAIERVPFVADALGEEPQGGPVVRFAFQDQEDEGLVVGGGVFRLQLQPGSLVTGAVSLRDVGLGLDARATWHDAEPAEETLARLEAVRARAANHIFMLMSGLTPVIESAELHQEGSSLVVRLMVPRFTLQAIWSLVSAQLAAQRSVNRQPAGLGPPR